MKLCYETITVINAKQTGEQGFDRYYKTVITGVTWFCEIVSAVDQGLKAANRFVVRIPLDADFGGKVFVEPLDYDKAEDVTGLFTLKNGDIVVRGAVNSDDLKPAQLHKNYDVFTVLGVTDNRRAPNEPHWKVVGA